MNHLRPAPCASYERERGSVNGHAWERALEMGHRNREIIELAHHHCTRMQFRLSGGHGLAEAETGLPIDMREIYCDVGGLGGMASNLQLIAADYVREHCRACPSRAATGRMPNLLTVTDAADVSAEKHRLEREVAEEEEKRRAQWRRNTRSALLAASDAGTHQLREDLDIIDAPHPAGHAGLVTAAHRRLAAVARRAPELFSGELIGQFFALVRDQGEDKLLTPLRFLARAGATPTDQVAVLACEVLTLRPSSEAAACLVDFPHSYRPEALTREVIMSCVRLVAGPVFTLTGRRESPRSADPAGLIAAADANLPAVLELVVELLDTPAPDRPALLLPPGSAQRSTGEAAQSVREAEARRHQGGVAARLLLAGGRCAWRHVSGPLLEALAQPDVDHFDLLPSYEVAAAVAEALLGEFDAVFTNLARVTPRSREHAEQLVKCLDHCRRLLSRDDPFLHREVRQTVQEAVAPRLCQAAVELLDGRWGSESWFDVASLVEDLAEQFPQTMAVHADALLGHMLLLRATSALPSMLLHPSPTGVPPALEHLSREQTVQASLRKVRSALAHCATQHPLRVLDAVLAADAAAGQPAPVGEQDVKRVRLIRRDCLDLACQIAGRYGEQPGVVARVLPLLYRRLLGEDTLLRMAAVEGWASLADKHPLPSSLADCGPVLLQDRYLAVIRAMLAHGRRLLHDKHMWSLIHLALRTVTAYRDDEDQHDLVVSALGIIYDERTRWDEEQVPQVERWILQQAAALSAYDCERLANWGGWSSTAAHSEQMAVLRMAALHDASLNDRFNNHDDLRYVRLMETAGGGARLPFSRFQALVSPDWLWTAVLLVEALQRFARWPEAHTLAQHIRKQLPPVPAYDSHRDLLQPVLDHTGSQADPSHRAERAPAWPVPAQQPDQLDDFLAQRDLTAHARLALRGELPDEISDSGGTDPAARRLAAAANRLGDIATRVEQAHQQATPTAGFLRSWAAALRVAAHLMRAHGALRRADINQERAHRQAALVRAEELREGLDANDPLHAALHAWLEQVCAMTLWDDRLASGLADVPVPLQVARGRSRRIGTYAPSEPAPVEEDPVVVCLLWLDDRRVTHGQVVHPSRAYTLRVEFRMDAWPVWADRLEVELLSVLSPDELVTPSFSLPRPTTSGEVNHPAEEGVSVCGEGTLVVRFSLGAGQPPQAVRVVARFRSEDGRALTADLAGYPELRLRPFDSTRDALTALPQVDIRLLALHEKVREFTDDEPTLQAFGRLLAAVTAVAAELTYDQLFRRGRYVSEARFHDEVDRRLKQDPLLGGRVDRATRQGLGITDVVHDGVACELKVERHKAFDVDRSRRYLGQPTQYASAVQQQLSILLVLDSTKKQQPVGVQENYLWLMRPELHAAASAPAPALVAVVVVNAGLPVPSNWSRRTITAEEIDLGSPGTLPAGHPQQGEQP